MLKQVGRGAMMSRRILVVAAVAVTLLTGVIAPANASNGAAAGGVTPLAGDCRVSYFYADTPEVWYDSRVSSWKVMGVAIVTNPAAAAGCRIRVCNANYYAAGGYYRYFGCADGIVAANEDYYTSYSVSVQNCTTWRTGARWEPGNFKLGVEVHIPC